jgi:uncharacterized membrane protein
MGGGSGSNGRMDKAASHRRRLPKVLRIVRARPRLFLSTLLAVTVIVLLPADWRLTTRVLIGWDAGMGAFLIAAFAMLLRSDSARMRRRATLQDEARFVILLLVVAAALASLGAIVAQLGASSVGASGRPPGHLALATLTILLSWAFVHVIFALHYAHEYHGAGTKGAGLAFPGGDEPDYWDFLYFSLVIGMTSQVSDVAVTGRTIRRTVAAHGVVSFLFNATLIALTVNIAASALVG